MTREKRDSRGEIVLYQAPDGTVELDVRLDRESLWLSLNQMSALFKRDKSVISRHLGNVFRTKELDRDSTVAFFATVQNEGGRTIKRDVEFYNLDAIISIGYRVNSKRGTQFRIWATSVLRDHILKGHTINERRLKELQQAIRVVADVASRRELAGDEAGALFHIVADYSLALDILDDYDHRRFAPMEPREGAVSVLAYDEALRIVDRLRERFGGSSLFGREKDQGLRSSLGAVMQSAGGRPQTCSTCWLKIIPSWTATNASARHSSFGSWKRTERSIFLTVTAGCQRLPW
jgi:hypothetical protein